MFDLYGALAGCRDLMTRFGGHRAAAGVSIATERIPELARRFDDAARAALRPEDLAPEVRIDLEVGIGDANAELEKLLHHFEPHGVGNPGPVLLSRGVRLNRPPRIVGENGLKLFLETPKGELEALGWGMAHRLGEVRDPFDIAYRLEREEWNGTSKLVARLVDFRV
jgi:single-stranded-DNA-specific exonuclease